MKKNGKVIVDYYYGVDWFNANLHEYYKDEFINLDGTRKSDFRGFLYFLMKNVIEYKFDQKFDDDVYEFTLPGDPEHKFSIEVKNEGPNKECIWTLFILSDETFSTEYQLSAYIGSHYVDILTNTGNGILNMVDDMYDDLVEHGKIVED